jgi:hypothetical protein
VPPEAWERALEKVLSAVEDLHRAAQPVRAEGALHVSITTALFEMDRPGGER